MEITFDNQGNKLIRVPPILSYENATPFKYLHTKTLSYLDETEELSDVNIGESKNGEKFLVIVYKDPLKPNVIFRFSKSLIECMNNGESDDFLLGCQFFYWEDASNTGHIRYARPIEIQNLKSLL